MKKFLLLAATFLSVPATAQVTLSSVQRIQGTNSITSGDPVKVVITDGAGAATVGTAASPSSSVSTVQGTAASGATATGNPIGIGGVYNSTPPTFTTGQRGDLQIGTRGSLSVQQALPNSAGLVTTQVNGADALSNSYNTYLGTSMNMLFNGATWDRASGNTSGQFVQGNIAAATTDSGRPVKIGGVYRVSWTPLTDGQRGDFAMDGQSRLRVTLGLDSTSASIASAVSNADGITPITIATQLVTNSDGYIFDGTNFNRQRSITGSDGTGLGVAAVAPAPQSSAAGAIVPSASAAVESNHVAKASAGNLYRVAITTGATAGYLMVFNATTAPADGAVAPLLCRAIAATSSLSIGLADMPARYTTGITLVFSSTGCFTKTASATAYFEWSVQ